MADRAQQIEALVREVTAAVMARLAPTPAAGASAGRALLLLPVPPPRPGALLGLAEAARRAGSALEVLANPAARAGLLEAGLGPSRDLDPAAAAAALGALAPGDVVVVGALGFAWAGRLAALSDDDPGVRLVLGALLGGRPVLAARDGLTPAESARGGAAARARELLRELSGLGLALHPLEELGARFQDLQAGRGPTGRVIGGLLGEADVEALHRAGERRVALARGCLVTPLARTRAMELGLELCEQEVLP